eukprot:COSAG02_NODE_3_length_74588_cov_108.368430_13_plen_203_part_00
MRCQHPQRFPLLSPHAACCRRWRVRPHVAKLASCARDTGVPARGFRAVLAAGAVWLWLCHRPRSAAPGGAQRSGLERPADGRTNQLQLGPSAVTCAFVATTFDGQGHGQRTRSQILGFQVPGGLRSIRGRRATVPRTAYATGHHASASQLDCRVSVWHNAHGRTGIHVHSLKTTSTAPAEGKGGDTAARALTPVSGGSQDRW